MLEELKVYLEAPGRDVIGPKKAKQNRRKKQNKITEKTKIKVPKNTKHT